MGSMDETNRFNDDGSLNDRRHKEDHHFLGVEIDRRRANSEMWSKIRTSLITSILFSMAGGIGAVIWFAITQFVKG